MLFECQCQYNVNMAVIQPIYSLSYEMGSPLLGCLLSTGGVFLKM